MKDSGIPWIGQIPEHWKILRNKNALVEIRNIVGEDTSFPLLSLSLNGVKLRDLDGGGKFPAEFNTYKKVSPNNLVFCLFDMDETPRTVGLSKHRGMITGAYNVYEVYPEVVTPNWVYYFYLSIDQQKALKPYYSGLRKVIRPETFAKIYMPVPPLKEQERIVVWLDKKCGEIDELIEVEQQMISDLESYRQAVITEAVTQGLNTDVPVKETSIPWISFIPEHWEEIRLKFLSRISTGDKDTIMANDEGEYPFFVRSPKVERINTFSYDGEAILMAGDGVGAGRVFHHFIGKFDWHQRVYNLHDLSSNIYGRFLFYFLLTNFHELIDAGSAKSTVDSVRLPMLTNFITLVPQLSEQQEIADYLDTKCAEIDKLIKVKQEKIETLKQYRQSLIFEAVTGKTNIPV